MCPARRAHRRARRVVAARAWRGRACCHPPGGLLPGDDRGPLSGGALRRHARPARTHPGGRRPRVLGGPGWLRRDASRPAPVRARPGTGRLARHVRVGCRRGSRGRQGARPGRCLGRRRQPHGLRPLCPTGRPIRRRFRRHDRCDWRRRGFGACPRARGPSRQAVLPRRRFRRGRRRGSHAGARGPPGRGGV